MADAVLLEDLSDGVLTLTLNRPSARNALSPELVGLLGEALDRFAGTGAIRAAVITGSGSAFCAGLDIKTYASAGVDREPVVSLLHRFARLPKPIIGAVNGPAVAGGLEIALGCDWLVGGPNASFADTHVRIGAFPGGGLTARLPRAVGAATARAMSLGGLRLDAHAALRAGLLTDVVGDDQLVSHVQQQAARIAAADPDLVSAVSTLYGDVTRPMAEALAAERAARQQWQARDRRDWSV